MGNLLRLEENYPEAESLINQAGKIIEEIEANPRRTDYLNKLGKLYLSWYSTNNNKDYLKQAIMHFEEALKLNEIYNIPYSRGKSLRYLGMAYYKANDVDRAIDLLKNSIEAFTELGSNYEASCSSFELAKILYETGRKQEAMFMVKSCLYDSGKYDYRTLQIKSTILLGDISQKTDYYLDALKLSMVEPIIYRRICFLMIDRIKRLDDKIKLKLIKEIKDINKDKYFESFLISLSTILKEKRFIIEGKLPISLKEELRFFVPHSTYDY